MTYRIYYSYFIALLLCAISGIILLSCGFQFNDIGRIVYYVCMIWTIIKLWDKNNIWSSIWVGIMWPVTHLSFVVYWISLRIFPIGKYKHLDKKGILL